MANIIKPKRSNTAGLTPTTSNLTSGELGVNMADQKVYINNGTSVVQIGAGNLSGLSDVTISTPTSGQSLSYNGTKWVNSSAGAGDVVGASSSTDNALVRFDGTTGKLIQNGVITQDDNGNVNNILSEQFADGSAVTVSAGKLWYNGTTGSWNLGMGGGNITQQVGEELFVYGKASSAINDSPLQIIYQTGTVGASGTITFAPTTSGITNGDLIIGCATEPISLNGFGRITSFGVIHGITTNGTAYGETWHDGDTIWYNPTTGNPTNIKPVAPNIKVQIGTIINAGNGGSGSFQVEINHGSVLGGTDSNVQLTSVSNANILTYDNASGYWRNTDLTAGTGISVTKASNGVLTVSNSGVTSVGATSPIASSGGATPTISISQASSTTNGYLSSTDWNTFNNKGSGTVTSVSGTAPISSTGGATPAISISQATTSTNGYLSSTDWNTFNNKGSGTVTSVSGTGTVSGLSLSGTVTSSGSLTLGGTLSADISAISDAYRWWNNFGQNHGTRTSFDAQGSASSVNFGYRYVQGNTNAPNVGNTGNGQYYSWFIGLGNDYAYNQYGAQFAIPRASTTPYLSVRFEEGGSFGAWQKMSAGYADSAGSVTNAHTAGTGLSGSTFNGSSAVTWTLATSGVTANTYGSSTAIPVITVDAYGRATSITTATVAGGQYFGTATTKAIAYNANSIGENITVTAGNNGLSAGPITISTGFTVTVETGANWVIV